MKKKKMAMKHKKGTFKMQGPDGRVHEMDNSHKANVQHLIDNDGDVEGYVMKYGGTVMAEGGEVNPQQEWQQGEQEPAAKNGIRIRKAKLGDGIGNQQEQNSVMQQQQSMLTPKNAFDPLQQEGNQFIQTMGSNPAVSTTMPTNIGPRIPEQQFTMQSMGQNSIQSVNPTPGLGTINTNGTPASKKKSGLSDPMKYWYMPYYAGQAQLGADDLKYHKGIQDNMAARQSTPLERKQIKTSIAGDKLQIAGGAIGQISGDIYDTVAPFAAGFHDMNVMKDDRAIRMHQQQNQAQINPYYGDSSELGNGTRSAYAKYGKKLGYGGKLGYLEYGGDNYHKPTVITERNEVTNNTDGVFKEGGDLHSDPSGGNLRNYKPGTVVHSASIGLKVGDVLSMLPSMPGGDFAATKIAEKYKDPDKEVSYADMAKPFITKDLDKQLVRLDKKIEKEDMYASSNNETKISRVTSQLNLKTLGKKAEQLEKERDMNLAVTGPDGPLHLISEDLKKSGAYGSEVQQEAKANAKFGKKVKLKLPIAGEGTLLNPKGYEAIDKFENTAGSPTGTSMNKPVGYSKTKEAEIKKFVENTIGLGTWNKMPSTLQTQVYSYMFNHGTTPDVWKGLAQAIAPEKVMANINADWSNPDTDNARQTLSPEDALNIIKGANLSDGNIYKNYVEQTLPAQYQSIADNYKGGFDQGQKILNASWKQRPGQLDKYLNEVEQQQTGVQAPAKEVSKATKLPSQIPPKLPQNYMGPYDAQHPKPEGYGDPAHFRKLMKNFSEETGYDFGKYYPADTPVDVLAADYQKALVTKYPQIIKNVVSQKGLPFTNKAIDIYKKHPDNKGSKAEPTPEDLVNFFQVHSNLIPDQFYDKKGGIRGVEMRDLPFSSKQEYDNFRKDKDWVQVGGGYYYDSSGNQTGVPQLFKPQYNFTDESTPAAQTKPVDSKLEQFSVTPQGAKIAQRNYYQEGLNPAQIAAPLMDLFSSKQAVPYIEDQGAKRALAASTRQRFTDIQPQLNRITRGVQATTQRNPTDAAANAQIYSNAWEQANQVYGQKYNADAQIEQNYNNTQNELMMRAGANKAQALNTLAERTATRDWKDYALRRNAVGEIGNKYLQNQNENRTSALYQDMFPNYNYNPLYGGTRFQNGVAPQIGINSTHSTNMNTLSENGKYDVAMSYDGNGKLKGYTRKEKGSGVTQEIPIGPQDVTTQKFGGKVKGKLPKKLPKKR